MNKVKYVWSVWLCNENDHVYMPVPFNTLTSSPSRIQLDLVYIL